MSAGNHRNDLSHQGPAGQLPAHVHLDTNEPEYGGVGGITSIDSALWMFVAVWEFCSRNEDYSLLEKYAIPLTKGDRWLRAIDANNCGMLEIPEAGDWTDLFARSYNVLYDEVLWFRSLKYYAKMLRVLGKEASASAYEQKAEHVRRVVLRTFWPTTGHLDVERGRHFSDVQFELGDSRYLVAKYRRSGTVGAAMYTATSWRSFLS